jgi:hypothetical protein
MKALLGVEYHRRDPNSVHTQVCDVIKMVLNTFEKKMD